MKIAVSTPTGQIGNKVARLLLQQDQHEVRLPARDPAKLKDERSAGAVVTRTDLADPDSLADALDGAEVFFFLIPPPNASGNERENHNRFTRVAVRAIEKANIQRIVYLSSLGAHLDSGTGAILGLHDAEQILKELNADVAFLRAGYFMENCFWVMDSILKNNTIPLPISGDAKMSFVATRDIAQNAVDLLTDSSWSGILIRELAGQIMTFNEIASVLSDVFEREVQHVTLTPEQTLEYMTSDEVGFNRNYVHEFIEAFQGMEAQIVVPEFPDMERGKTPTTFREFAKETLLPLIKQ